MSKYPRLFAATVFGFVNLAPFAMAQKNVGTDPAAHLKSVDDDSPTETVLEIDEGAFLGYGGVRYGSQYLNSRWHPVVGLRGAWLYRESIAIGVDFSTITQDMHPSSAPELRDIKQNLSTAGFIVEKIYHPRKRLHLTTALGFGQVQSNFSVNANSALPDEFKDSRKASYVAPEVTLTVNATKYLRASIGANLLLPFAGSGSSQIKDRTFLGGGVFVGLNFGNFQ